MRIALVAPLISPIREPQIGGVATLLTDLALGIQQAGHEVSLFAASGSRMDGIHVVDTGIRPEELAETVFRPLAAAAPASQSRRRSQLARRAFERVYGLVAGGQFDVVHNHSFDAEAIVRACRLGCPVVHSLHLPPDPAVSRAVAEAQSSPRPPVVAAVSRSQLEGWRRLNRIDVLLPAGIPTARIPWSATASGGLLLAGRISPEKGVLDAVQIAAVCGMPLTIAGNRYDEDYARRVDEAAERAGGIRFAGSLPRRRLWDLMASSAALLFPIRWEEPFGLVTAEAQAAGCPVVGYRRGALSDVIADGETGIAVDPGDLQAAAGAVPRAMAFNRRRCRHHAESALDIGPPVEAHLRLYERLAAGEAAAG